MIGLDTNILARYLLRDDEAQYQIAAGLLKEPQTYTAPSSVILELVWVLESEDCDRAAVSRALRLYSRCETSSRWNSMRYCTRLRGMNPVTTSAMPFTLPCRPRRSSKVS